MNIEMIRAAQKRLSGYARRTPMLSSTLLNQIAGKRVFVKAECLQQTGSFKYRGARSALSAMQASDRARGVMAFSSGNHAQGVALAARQYGVHASIVMPTDAPEMKVRNTRSYGAEVIFYGRTDSNRKMIWEGLEAEKGLTMIKPFDDEQVIAGQGTVGLELAEQAVELELDAKEVLVPVGGGGLASGIALALEATAPDLRVRTVEPDGFDDVARSLKAGEILSNEKLDGSICDAIVAPVPGFVTFPIMHRLCGSGLCVSDQECLKAMALAWAHLKIVLEPGGAAAFAAALFHSDQIEGDDVIVVASGGNVDKPIFDKALASI